MIYGFRIWGQARPESDRPAVDTGQPGEEDFARLAEQGYAAVVDLRTEGEPNQPLPPAEEGGAVRKAGMEYIHIPVPIGNPLPEQVDRFREELSPLEGMVLVHCASGKRSGALAVLDAAAREGLSGDEAVSRAKDLGFDWKSPELETFVRRYRER